ncbi:type VI secretion system ATPase TssH, partial [Neorhizobium galegae]|nr:type VI secretion system ATPase TssH [Neorhizobium galegae]
ARQLPDKAISLIDTAAAGVALARQTSPEALKLLNNERDLLETEARWLAGEPETPGHVARLAEIARERGDIGAEIEALGARFDEEMRLAREADLLEDVCAHDPASWPLSPAGEASGSTNIAPFPPQAMTPESARTALASTERSLVAVAGETPLMPRVVDKEAVAAVISR